MKRPSLHTLGDMTERFTFESRWLLFPFILGLILALGVYVVRFSMDDYYFITHSFHADFEDVVVMLLGLVDSFMVANLLVMIVKGSYQIFIRKFELETRKPGWLDHIDTGLLKVKTSQSIASITGVALLKDFVNLDKLGWVLVEHRLIVHCVCLVSALVMAAMWRITHVDEPHHEEAHVDHGPEELEAPPMPEAIKQAYREALETMGSPRGMGFEDRPLPDYTGKEMTFYTYGPLSETLLNPHIVPNPPTTEESHAH